MYSAACRVYLPIWQSTTSWENHHCKKHGNAQISPNLTHKLWKRLAPGMPGRFYQTKPDLLSGYQVNIKCFYAKSTCLGSNYRNISRSWCSRSFQDMCRGLWIIIAELPVAYFPWSFAWCAPHVDRNCFHFKGLRNRTPPWLFQDMTCPTSCPPILTTTPLISFMW
jgi:hypothetical protein